MCSRLTLIAVTVLGLFQRAVPGTAPCTIVTGCIAAYSTQRRMVATYTGPLFRLVKSGGTTQDVGQTAAGLVNMATIASFCGTVSGVGTSTTTTNSCDVSIIYDHTANHNDMTGKICNSPYAVNAQGKPIFINKLAAACYYGDDTPTNAPNGNTAASLYVVGNDALRPPAPGIAGYGLDFGILHAVGDPNNTGSSYDLILRGGTAHSSDFSTFGVDLESDVAELAYGYNDANTTTFNLSPNIASFAFVGDYVGTSSYNPSSTVILIDFNNGQRSYSAPYAGMNMGEGDPHIREGWTGDNSGSDPAAWYEGAIYASTLTLGQQRQIETDAQGFYQITKTPSCTNAPRLGGVDLIGGSSTVTGAWGLRQLDPNFRTAVAIIDRVSDNALRVIGTIPGTCDLNTADAATFCTATTCHVWILFNQVLSKVGHLENWTIPLVDDTQLHAASFSFTNGPTLTFSGLGSLPVMTFASGSSLLSASTSLGVTRPWSMLAAVNSTTNGAFFSGVGVGTALLGSTSTNTLQVLAGSGSWTATSADSAWHAVAGMVPTNTSLMTCVNATCTTSGVVSTADATASTWKIGGFAGAMTEMYLVNGTAVSSSQAAALSAAQRSYWGF